MARRYHNECWDQGVYAGAEAFTARTEAVAAKKRSEQEFREANAFLRERHTQALGEFVFELDEHHYESGHLGVEPTLFQYRYTFRVRPCSVINCCACYEAGLIEENEAPQAAVSLLHEQAMGRV